MPSRSRSLRPEALAWGVRHWAEALARTHLEARGFAFLDANVVLPGGELDLVMRHGRTIVFIEVRQRRSARYGSAAESLTAAKRARLRRTARSWAVRRYGAADRPMRIDAVLVQGGPDRPRIEHLQDVA